MVTPKQALEALDRFAWHMGRPHHPDAAILREYIKQDAAAPNLAMMVRRLCSRTPDGAPRITDKTRADALALLEKHGLLGSGLRDQEADAAVASSQNGDSRFGADAIKEALK